MKNIRRKFLNTSLFSLGVLMEHPIDILNLQLLAERAVNEKLLRMRGKFSSFENEGGTLIYL